MKVALLQAHHIPEHRQVHSGGNYPHVFANMFARTETIIDIDWYDVTKGDYPEDPAIYDAFLISGSSASAFDNEPWIGILKEYIQKIFKEKHKIIGVCFGHQIIAEALGGKVIRAKKGWGIGVKTIDVISRQPWMQPYQHHCSLLFYHQDHVILEPDNAIILARNEFCEIQMYCIGAQVLGIQAHPEMLSGHNHSIIMDARGDLDDYMIQSAVESLRIRDQGILVGHWITNFIEANND
jgi:GMP synthase-like glutamine amidotransferase